MAYDLTLKQVYSQIAPEVKDLYEYYREKKGLEEESNTEKQLDILAAKKYISITYISDISLIVDYYERGMIDKYEIALRKYKNRIRFFLDN